MKALAHVILFLAILGLARAAESPSANGTEVLADSVLRFLQETNTDRFVEGTAFSMEDWQAEAKRHGSDATVLEKYVESARKEVRESATRFLDQARRFGLDPSRIPWQLKDVKPTKPNTFRHPKIHAERQNLPYVQQIYLTLQVPSGTAADAKFAGEYEVELGACLRFPSGWRLQRGIRWLKFPRGVADPVTEDELALLAQLTPSDNLTGKDDPALARLGETIMKFLADKSESVFTNELLLTMDEMFKAAERAGRELPSRKDAQKAFEPFFKKHLASARTVLADADRFGLDFSRMKVADVQAENVRASGPFGVIASIDARAIRFVFSPKAESPDDAKPAQYVLATDRAQRILGRWFVGEIRWEKVPEGTLNQGDLAKMQFENHVAKHGTLPTSTAVPDIRMIRADDQQPIQLSSLKGKVVVLEWWASWCGPCQEPMKKMQSVRAEHPDWGDKVEIVSLSIDDKLETAKKHMQKNGWTNTLSFWSGSGGWNSPPAKEFRVTGIPKLYVIDREGKVAYAGHPASPAWQTQVQRLLR